MGHWAWRSRWVGRGKGRAFLDKIEVYGYSLRLCSIIHWSWGEVVGGGSRYFFLYLFEKVALWMCGWECLLSVDASRRSSRFRRRVRARLRDPTIAVRSEYPYPVRFCPVVLGPVVNQEPAFYAASNDANFDEVSVL